MNIVKTTKRQATKQLTYKINVYGANISPRSMRRVLNRKGLNQAPTPTTEDPGKQNITSTMAKNRSEPAKGLTHWTTKEWGNVCKRYLILVVVEVLKF